MFSTVEVMRELTTVTNSIIMVGELFINIWKATVSSDPLVLTSPFPLLDARAFVIDCPSSEMTMPDGKNGIVDESSPFIVLFMSSILVEEYTTYDPRGSVQLS